MDLTLGEVAELLNVKIATMDRWLLDGNIPSYQIGGETRFNRREIEDWIIQHHADDGMPFPEGTPRGTLQFSLFRAIHKGGVLSSVPGLTKEEVIRNSVDTIASHLDLDADVLAEMLLDRERLQSTALGEGIALPHTRDFLLDSHFDAVTVVFPEKELEYGALDGEPVHTLFFLFACDDKRHLNLLSKIALFCNDKERREWLKARPSRHEFLDRIKAWEAQIQCQAVAV